MWVEAPSHRDVWRGVRFAFESACVSFTLLAGKLQDFSLLKSQKFLVQNMHMMTLGSPHFIPWF